MAAQAKVKEVSNEPTQPIDLDEGVLSDDTVNQLLDEIDADNKTPKWSSPVDILNANNDDDEKSILPLEVRECFEIAIDAALEAGELVTKYIYDTGSKSQSLLTKATKSDFQTQFDSRTEKLIISKIKRKFPKHDIMAEESTDDTASFAFTDNVTWIIDPIDGTTNFLHGHNNVGICIGIKYKKVSVVGVVYIPLWKELFFAVKGKGAYIMYIDGSNSRKLNKIERIYTNKTNEKIQTAQDLSNAMVLLETGYRRDLAHCKHFSKIMYELLATYKVRSIRMFGCCSVHMCCIASGRGDVFFETGNLKPWDMVAGQVIVEEAGGHLLLADGDPFVCTKGQILCCQSKQVAQLMIDIDILTP